MKFRTISKNPEAIQYILKSLSVATKLTSNVVFRISSSGIQLIADPSYRSGPLLSRCELSKENLFTEYIFNGINSQHNLIFFEVRCDSLSNILHSFQSNIRSLKFKLANGLDGRFILAISVEYPSLDSSRFINHNVYINIINRKQWSMFDEQILEPVQISLYLPNFKRIGSTIERLASLAQFAVISGKYQLDDKAYFTVGLCNDSISVKSKYSNLDLNKRTNVSSDPEDMHYKLRIDIRKLHHVFSALSTLKPSTISCDISHENAVCFHFYHELSNFKILLPNYDY